MKKSLVKIAHICSCGKLLTLEERAFNEDTCNDCQRVINAKAMKVLIEYLKNVKL